MYYLYNTAHKGVGIIILFGRQLHLFITFLLSFIYLFVIPLLFSVFMVEMKRELR